ncbi:MAG TPA: ATP-binding cassette domain-containing protein, partial [Isosphaeraceae bacterium]|nr:ATP-binding cassette domain-containing protein [Isosphaeraceae bacterium]
GFDVLDQPLEVRKRVGYLPENVPLYPEMRVREFLRFRAKLKDVPRAQRRAAIGGVIERCGLAEVEDRMLGQLSKGFRQRVGLAEAMLHDPDILILDEPTAGLDPIQVREVRALIRELGQRHTILLSTHIMPEVEAVCGRVILIARGRIAIDEELETIRSATALLVEVRGPADAMRKVIQAVPGVARVTLPASEAEHAAFTAFEVQLEPGADPREIVAERLISNGWGLRQLVLRRSSLEDRFVQAVSETAIPSEAEAPSAIEAA